MGLLTQKNFELVVDRNLKLWGEKAIAGIETFSVVECDNHIGGTKKFWNCEVQ